MLEIMGRTKIIYVKEEIKWVIKVTLNIKHYIKIKPDKNLKSTWL